MSRGARVAALSLMAVSCVSMGEPSPRGNGAGVRDGTYSGDSDCCEPSHVGRTGCDDDVCEMMICDNDPYCCETEWDSLCSDAALDDCMVCQEGYDEGGDGGDVGDDGAADGGPGPGGGEELCCVSGCCADPWGAPMACPSGEVGPFPSTQPFNCPVKDVPYTTCAEGEPNFDCDDFSYACKMWGDANGYHICQYVFSGHWLDWDKTLAHAINIVEFEYPTSSLNTKYCFIEPQGNVEVACWIQPNGAPVPPSFATEQLRAYYKLGAGTFKEFSVWCDPTDYSTEFPGGENEACFTTDAALCELFEEESQLCSETFGPLPPKPPSPEMTACFGVNGNNETCYWECPQPALCGDTCYTCADAAEEPDEPEEPPATGYHNTVNCHDVNNDGYVSSLDALIIINYINAGGNPSPVGSGPPYFDTNDDGFVSPIDVLGVVNHLNGGSSTC